MPRRDADRNLLFGILALQMDFMTRDALIAAMNAWVMEKHRTIGEILVERGDLDPEAREALSRMVDLHVVKHGGDPAASLASLSTAGGIASDLRREVADPDVRASLAPVPATRIDDDSYATRSDVPPEPPHAGIRYRKDREYARGNLGVVFVARDIELNREVALKEIKDQHADHPHHRSRFLLEAEVTGGLEHPGIVPVYGLGHHEDGRPFYAMRFVRGDSLMQAIGRFHADPAPKSDPGERNLALQKLLRRFVDVCNAVEYAHSRGILHRDLKPANVMVGKYGETLVVDWGLAKAVGRSGDRDETLPEASLHPASAGGSDASLPGSVVGTPAYMPPEQAAGRLELLGPASDVYGLGATLYHLLVGRPPITGRDLGEVLHKVQAGEFPRPRASSPWLDPALEAICLKAMALRPGDRYASPRALADDVERWIAGEPVAAYPEPFLRRARRWSLRHRTTLATSTTAATVAALLLGGLTWSRIEQRRRIDASAMLALGQAERLAIEGRVAHDPAKWAEAVAEARRAEAQLESGGGSLDLRRRVAGRIKSIRAEEGRLNAALRDAELDRQASDRNRRIVADLDEARLRAANLKDGRFDLAAKHEAFLAVFVASGIDVATLPVEEAAGRIRSRRIADDLISVLDDWALERPSNVPGSRLGAIARAAETDPTRAAVRDAVARGDAAGLRRLCEREQDRRVLGMKLRSAFNALVQLDPVGSLPLLETIQREHPSDFWLTLNLGAAYLKPVPPRTQEAVRCYSVAVALRPDSSTIRVLLGFALTLQGRLDEGLATCREAIRLKPDDPLAFLGFSAVLAAQNKFEEAVTACREAVRLGPDFAMAHATLGFVLKSQGKLDGAIAEYREAIRLKPDYDDARAEISFSLIAQGKPDEAVAAGREAVRLKPNLAIAHNALGYALKAQGKPEEAVAEYREAIRLNPDLSFVHFNLGFALADQRKPEEAAAAYREAIRLKPEDAFAHNNLGLALKAQGKLDEAIAAYREAIRLKPEDAMAHYNLGLALVDQGKAEEAIAAYREAIRLKPDYATANYGLGIALKALGRVEEAIAAYREAIRLKPDYVDAQLNLGLALTDQSKPEEAIAACREAIRLKPDYALPYNALGNALKAQGKADEAIAAYREAIRLKPDFARAHFNLGDALYDQDRLDEAAVAIREAARLEPNYAEAHCGIGQILMRQGQFQEALENIQRGHGLGFRRPDWSYPSENLLREARRKVELDAKLPAILKGDVKPAGVAELWELAIVCYLKRLEVSAVRLAEEAFAKLPELADDIESGNRYNAACAAALAGTGLSKDDPPPDEADRARFREKALGWLRADLAIGARLLDDADASTRDKIAAWLAHWKKDADLAGIREEIGLAKLPEAERDAFRSLWADVEALRKKASQEK